MLDKVKKYVLLGSCFSQYMGARMEAEGYHAVCNPLGTLFNPESIRNTVLHALKGNADFLPMFRDEAMQEWRCWWANTRFRSSEEQVSRAEVQCSFEGLGKALREADKLFITLGTNVCYRLTEQTPYPMMCVSNCQRQADALFREDRLPLDRVIAVLKEALEALFAENPRLQVIFTLSPFRYKKYGWHGSQLSKATLMLAIDTLQREYPERVDYFPSYEIMMDELRDYRYYAEDGLHPSMEAVDIIWNKLCE